MDSSPAPPERHWISPQGAATRQDVHVETIYRWIRTGRLTAYRQGPHLIRIDVAELDAMLQAIPTGGHDAD